MTYPDPMQVNCDACGSSVKVPLKDLVQLRGVCSHCGVSLAAVGEQFLRVGDQRTMQFLFVEAIMDLEDNFSVTVPDAVAESVADTKASFVNTIVTYFEPIHPAVTAAVVSESFDNTWVKAGHDLPASPDQSLLEALESERRRKRLVDESVSRPEPI